ncbi:MAG: hypothetical protein MZV63_19465 [Marinilabiliales bacterium]|nr:hypothetical protein [Marinilabiliales bacterium]
MRVTPAFYSVYHPGVAGGDGDAGSGRIRRRTARPDRRFREQWGWLMLLASLGVLMSAAYAVQDHRAACSPARSAPGTGATPGFAAPANWRCGDSAGDRDCWFWD